MNPITGAITVALADDHTIVRECLHRLLSREVDVEVVGCVGSGHELLDVIRHESVDVAIVDLSLRDTPAMELIHRISNEFSNVAVLVLSMHAEEHYVVRTLRSGASGYITKDSPYEELLRAIRKVSQGGTYLTDALAEQVTRGLRRAQPEALHETLSNRELEVYRRIVEGMRLTDIAEELHLSIKTVSTHKSRIMEKLRTDCTASLVRYGLQHQLFGTPTPNSSAL